MKSLVLCALVAVAGVVLAAPQNVQDVQLLRYDSDNDGLTIDLQFRLVLCALVAVAGVVLAAPQNVQDVQLLRFYSNNYGLGTYSFGYAQSDGSRRDEEGELRNAGAENEFVEVNGSFSWISPEGFNITITFIADDKGYQPKIETRGGLPQAVVASLLG